ncbi:MAG TPA: hypothetical protein VGH79_12375 [Gaiellaceae bacterium]|jgi:hypothetical protein
MNTFDDDTDATYLGEPPRRPPRGRPQRSGPRRAAGPTDGSSSVLRVAAFVVLGIVIVFGFVFWIGSCSGQSKQQDYASYIAAMQNLATKSASVGKVFGNELGSPGLTMQGFQSDLTRWAQQQQSDYVAAQRLRPPGPLQNAHQYALATFYLRQAALTNLANTLTIAKEKHEAPSLAGAQLASEAQHLSTSDDLWAQLYQQLATQVLKDQHVTGVIVPASQIVKNSAILSASQLAPFYQRLSSPSNGHTVTGLHGMRVASASAIQGGVTTALSETTTATVALGVGSGTVIEVMVENNGAFQEVRIPVTLTLKSKDHRLSPPVTKTISQIAPGTQVPVQFTDIQVPPSAFSQSAFLVVHVATVPGEKQHSDNVATYKVFLRLAKS